MNFWEALPKPFSVLAPMEDVTDTVFRQVIIKAGRPDVFFTEFTNIDGLDSAGYEKVAQRLRFSEVERPVVAQIWGRDPEKYRKAAEKIKQLGFDGIDINMGCPAKEVLNTGCGAALSRMENRGLVTEIIKVVKEVGLPVSVKTRLGDRKIEDGWIEFLLEQNLAALTVHARIAKDMSLVPADWGEIRKVVNSKNQNPNPKTKIIGNGDIKSLDDPRIRESGVDGVMIGRGIFENPWLFRQGLPEEKKNLEILKYHLELWDRTWGTTKNFAVMKKYFKIYIRGWDGASDLRASLMETQSVDEALAKC